VDEFIDDAEPTKDANWGNKRPMPMYSSGTLEVPVNPLVGSASRRQSEFAGKDSASRR
jgi:hypothetical protein